jgi:hypothetical protein
MRGLYLSSLSWGGKMRRQKASQQVGAIIIGTLASSRNHSVNIFFSQLLFILRFPCSKETFKMAKDTFSCIRKEKAKDYLILHKAHIHGAISGHTPASSVAFGGPGNLGSTLYKTGM